MLSYSLYWQLLCSLCLSGSLSSVVDLSLDTTELVNYNTAFSWNIIKVGHGDDNRLHQIAVDPGTNVGNVLKVNFLSKKNGCRDPAYPDINRL
jgi:hypothetical protein